ncbi:MAG TPA: LytTR family DNA-binding domain-containing protein [Puia sp.]|jgi:DNA-binding LytR/AlgR family response regulator|nr:LytTR family DNA-binding domain-containing protein [Puia sp.]
MRTYNCIIIEDEPLAAEVLQDYIKQVPFLKLVCCCSDAFYAMESLQKFDIDLMFLDIHLPKMKGLDFIKVLKNPPKIIITSAYQEYALQGYEFNVIDYLLKPIEFSRFLKAVNKIEQTKEVVLPARPVALPTDRVYLFFNVGKKKVKVFLDEILYIESMKEYIRVNTKNKSVLTKFKLSQVDELLSANNFLRIHRSFIVAKDKIEAFSATEVELSGKRLPIGRSYKELVLSVLEV